VITALKILGVIAVLMGYLVVCPILGERLQDLRRPGMARLEFPGKYFPGWAEYLDAARYETRARRYIGALWVLMFVVPPVALVLFLAHFWS
jgi:hypothetical protein